jgi:hypothetical protein
MATSRWIDSAAAAPRPGIAAGLDITANHVLAGLTIRPQDQVREDRERARAARYVITRARNPRDRDLLLDAFGLTETAAEMSAEAQALEWVAAIRRCRTPAALAALGKRIGLGVLDHNHEVAAAFTARLRLLTAAEDANPAKPRTKPARPGRKKSA